MGSLPLIAWGLVAGIITNAVIAWFPESWEYAPGIVIGIILAGYFYKDIFPPGRRMHVRILKLLAFLTVATIAYRFTLDVAEWIMSVSGFPTFNSYAAPTAESALFAAFFLGGCIGAFFLAFGLRFLVFKFKLALGLFTFMTIAAVLGSVIAVAFETFGFIPLFAFPIWNTGMAAAIAYLYDSAKNPGPQPENSTELLQKIELSG